MPKKDDTFIDIAKTSFRAKELYRLYESIRIWKHLYVN